MTAGLEAKLLLANSARVMLSRNIDTKQGLVNGAIGTITRLHVKVKFDHITQLYMVESTESMVMRNFYVYAKLLLANSARVMLRHNIDTKQGVPSALSQDCVLKSNLIT